MTLTKYQINLNKAKHDYCSTQVNIKNPLAKQITDWTLNNVPKEDIHTSDDIKGYEDEPHCTVFYGIEDKNLKESIDKQLKWEGVNVLSGTLDIMDKFEQDGNDVLIIKVDGLGFRVAHNIINSITDTAGKDYQPHVTLAYVKKGVADKFLANDTFKGKQFEGPVLFCDKNENKITLKSKRSHD